MQPTYSTSTNDIHIIGEQIDNLALALIAPLGSEHTVSATPVAIVQFVLRDSHRATTGTVEQFAVRNCSRGHRTVVCAIVVTVRVAIHHQVMTIA